jgi:hypothetical protein
MYLNILSKEQEVLLPFLKQFNKKFILVGGTGIALQIGHRKSIDFDLFCIKPFKKTDIKKSISEIKFNKQLLFEDGDGIHYLINDVKITFFYYPFKINGLIKVGDCLKMPDLLTLAAMKFYAMGRRAKWKDYVDIYFLLKNNFTIPQVSQKAIELFEDGYSEKLFRQQLVFFEDIDYSETVDWITTPVDDETIKKELIKFSLQIN